MTDATLRCLLSDYIPKHGKPLRILSDQGTQYNIYSCTYMYKDLNPSCDSSLQYAHLVTMFTLCKYF